MKEESLDETICKGLKGGVQNKTQSKSWEMAVGTPSRGGSCRVPARSSQTRFNRETINAEWSAVLSSERTSPADAYRYLCCALSQ